MPILRPGTFDAAIWSGVGREYPGVPERFEPGDRVLDVGCHTGAFCVLAAQRGARVLGYEACPENYDLARKNTAHLPRVEVRWGAVWRSDGVDAELAVRPDSDPENTGGGSVLYGAAGAGPDGTCPDGETRPTVPAVPLDRILRELGRVRLLKIDVEGAEFPVLATSRELHRVEIVVGEIHRLTPEERAGLSPAARQGISYDPDELLALLGSQGFTLLPRPWDGLQMRFAAVRARPLRPLRAERSG